MAKRFHLPASAIKPLATGHGSCYATDRITVDADRVGYLYREPAETDQDSGWRFFAGSESDEYVNNPINTALYDVNTIANYDPEIIPLLTAPPGSAFAREGPGGSFVPVEFPGGADT